MSRRQLRVVQGGGSAKRACRADASLPPPDGPEALAENPGLQAMLDRGMRAIVALSGASGGAIRLVTANGGPLRLMSAVGLSPESIANERSVPQDCGICGVALKANGTRLEAHPQVCARRVGAFAGHTEAGPVLALPLHCRGRAIGIFNLFFGDAERVPGDLAGLLEPTAQMLDLILDNAMVEHERLRASLVAERQLIASEVHDSLAQGLAYMRMRMPLLHDAVLGGEREHALKYFKDVNDAMGEAHARLRELITHFRHAIDQGLLQALESTARTFEDRTGVALSIDNRVTELRLAPDHEMQVYQIVQEALANVIKHAGARNARIVIERDARGLRISVEDDGCGVPQRRARGKGEHYGLNIMRERAQRIGASLQIRSAPGKGTRVRLLLPRPAMGEL